jgi:hypothetical protein
MQIINFKLFFFLKKKSIFFFLSINKKYITSLKMIEREKK